MPIHDFGSFKKIEDAEKEVEDGKAKEIEVVQNKAHRPNIDKPRTQEEDDNTRKKHRQKRDEKPKKVGKKEVKKTSHPLIHGTLEIEEEEL